MNSRDLREMSEEEFREMFASLKSKTKNFTEVRPELILENNQYLLILRMCLGLSQREFAKKLGVTKDWCRHTEAGRNRIIHKSIADRYASKIEDLLEEKNIKLNKTMDYWNSYIFYSKEQILSKPKIQLKQISKMTEDDIKNYFELINDKTCNFTKFYPELLAEIPQSLLIFRIILGIDHRKFSNILGIDSRTVRKYEHLEMQIKTTTAKKFIEKIGILFSKYNKNNINSTRTIENFRILSNFYGHRNLEAMFERGLKFAENQELSEIEKEIETIFKSNSIDFKSHAIVSGAKRRLNIDFIIPSENPKIIIECTSINIGARKISNNRNTICNIDHRFQMLKMKNPNLITIMILRFTGKPVYMPNVKKLIETEILNTDYYIINDEIEKIPKLVKNILKR